MATSGTYSFAVTATQLYQAAFSAMQVYGPNDAGMTSADTSRASFSLEMLVKAMANKGLPLWCVQDLAVPMIAGQSTYSLGSPRPLRLLFAYLRDSSGNDVTVQIYSRYDYDTLGQKASTGVVNQLFYDPQIGDGATAPPGSGIVTVYDVPSDSTYTLHVIVQRSIQDVGTASNNLDFPQEAYMMLKWRLAEELMLDYEVPDNVRREIRMFAKQYTDEFWDTTQEQASIYLTPSERTR
jgi:hypothetical protein